jgi:hypothetical protein
MEKTIALLEKERERTIEKIKNCSDSVQRSYLHNVLARYRKELLALSEARDVVRKYTKSEEVTT